MLQTPWDPNIFDQTVKACSDAELIELYRAVRREAVQRELVGDGDQEWQRDPGTSPGTKH